MRVRTAANSMSYLVSTRQLPCLSGSGGIEVRSVGLDRKWQSGDRRDDPRDLPASQNDSTDSGAQHTMASAEGKLVGKALLEVHSAIEVQRSIVSALVDPE